MGLGLQREATQRVPMYILTVRTKARRITSRNTTERTYCDYVSTYYELLATTATAFTTNSCNYCWDYRWDYRCC